MIHIFHKWGPWEIVDRRRMGHLLQQRTCAECGLTQTKVK